MTAWAIATCHGCSRKIAVRVRPPEDWLCPDQWCRGCGGTASTAPDDIARVQAAA